MVLWYAGVDANDWAKYATAIGAILSFAFFVQKQKLDDTKLFKELFTDFNKRYDELNEELNRIVQEPASTPLTKEQIDTLFNYFNLCGEEYLMFHKGYIYPEVWNSWLTGMRFFYDSPRIGPLWDHELAGGSYYGMRLDGH